MQDIGEHLYFSLVRTILYRKRNFSSTLWDSLKLMMKIGKCVINDGDKQQFCQTFMQLLSPKNIQNYKNVYEVTVKNECCEVAYLFWISISCFTPPSKKFLQKLQKDIPFSILTFLTLSLCTILKKCLRKAFKEHITEIF